MGRFAMLVAMVVLAVTPILAQDTAKEKKVDVTGVWEMTVESPQGSMTITATYKQEGETLTGTHVSEMGEAPLKGTVKGVDIAYTLTIDMGGQQFTIAHTGKVDGDTIKGDLKVEIPSADALKLEWKATRQKK